jgi:hypothetical protein
MAFKARVLVPFTALTAAMLLTACPPPGPNPPPGSTTTTQPPPVCPAAGTDATPGPNSPNPIQSWGINGTAYSVVAIGDIVYVGGTFSQAVAPNGQKVSRSNLAAFCIKTGALLNTFEGDTNNRVWALTTDGTYLYVGGEFTMYNGQPSNRLVKVHPTTGAQIAMPNLPTIPDDVLALAFRAANSSIYIGGDFDIAGPGRRKGASVNKDTGALTGWNIDADGRVESLELSGGLAQSTVYIGGSFDVVNNVAHNALARTNADTGVVDSIVFSRKTLPDSGLIQGRIFDIAVDSNNVPYVAIGPARPGGTNGGNKFARYDPTTGANVWEQKGPDGDAQAIELINGTLYGGFHGGWGVGNTVDTTKRLMGMSPATGATSGFGPNSGGVLGVRGLAQDRGRLFAVGDFASMGGTNKLNGLAIFN